MNHSRERLAWFVLLLSFATCLALVIGTPLGMRTFINTARVRQPVVVEPQRGTPRLIREGRMVAEAVVGPANNIYPNSIVTTDEADHARLTCYAPGEDPIVVADVQIYNNTDVTFITGRSPRFQSSPLPHKVVLEVRTGRVRVTVGSAHERPTVVSLRTPHMEASLADGSYDIRISPALSEIAVRSGYAQVTSEEGSSIQLGPSQRTIALEDSSSLQALDGERNLLQNGNFEQGLAPWILYRERVQNEPGGDVEATIYDGRHVARFQRLEEGLGHTEVGIRQELNHYDVRDFASLNMHLNVLILYQSLPGCGSLGSECPIILRIDYEDVQGTDRQYYHSFYAIDVAPEDLLQEGEDEQIPYQRWYTFDSGNLIELLEPPPAFIKEVRVYASGHAFDAMVTEVELLAQE